MNILKEIDTTKIKSIEDKYRDIGVGIVSNDKNISIDVKLKEFLSKISFFTKPYPHYLPLYFDKLWKFIYKGNDSFFKNPNNFSGYTGRFNGSEDKYKVLDRVINTDGLDTILHKKLYKYIKENFITNYDFHSINGKSYIKAYRKVIIDDSTDIKNKYGGIGIYWTIDKSKADVYNLTKYEEYEVIIEALIDINNIDWEQSFTRNIRFGTDEMEINPYRGSLIYITKLYISDTKTKEAIEQDYSNNMIKAKA